MASAAPGCFSSSRHPEDRGVGYSSEPENRVGYGVLCSVWDVGALRAAMQQLCHDVLRLVRWVLWPLLLLPCFVGSGEREVGVPHPGATGTQAGIDVASHGRPCLRLAQLDRLATPTSMYTHVLAPGVLQSIAL